MSGELWLLLGLGALVALWAVPTGLAWLQNRRLAEQVVTAELVDKAIEQETGSGWEAAEHYCLTFALEGSRQQRFQVSEQEYQNRSVGERGALRVQGVWYRGFAPQDSPRRTTR